MLVLGTAHLSAWEQYGNAIDYWIRALAPGTCEQVSTPLHSHFADRAGQDAIQVHSPLATHHSPLTTHHSPLFLARPLQLYVYVVLRGELEEPVEEEATALVDPLEA